MKNQDAQALARLGKGIKKRLTRAQRLARAKQMRLNTIARDAKRRLAKQASACNGAPP